jgi:hypothetical protein
MQDAQEGGKTGSPLSGETNYFVGFEVLKQVTTSSRSDWAGTPCN